MSSKPLVQPPIGALVPLPLRLFLCKKLQILLDFLLPILYNIYKRLGENKFKGGQIMKRFNNRYKWEGFLNVDNMEQKIIFFTEMQGQLSDGMWENMEPDNHWRPWCSLKWDDVHIDPDNLGVGGNLQNAPKRDYSFNSRELLEIVGDRVRFKVNLWKNLGELILAVYKNDHWLIPDDGLLPTGDLDDYYTKKRADLLSQGLTESVMQDALNYGSYSMKDLRKDCNRLSKIFYMDAQSFLK